RGYDVKRSDFPPQFLFGAATSAYQIEGGFNEDGKGFSNWDAFCRINGIWIGSIKDGKSGDVADDHYHRYMEDIEIMQSVGITVYRFSISWSRVLPRGTLGGVNKAGIAFYNKIIDNLLLKGIEPFVTIHHNEYPDEFDDRFLGDELLHFAETCFEHFGDRVKYWITINEPVLTSYMSYELGLYSPARCSPPFGHCTHGNSDVEPLLTTHNKIVAHAKASKLYRDKFKATSNVNGMLGICDNSMMYVPSRNTEDDKEAARRAMAFGIGWVMDAVIFGDYPPEMKRILGDQMPTFSSEEKILLEDSIDFIGVNHYSTLFAKDCIRSNCSETSNRPIRGFVETSGENSNGVLIGERTGMLNFFVVPSGMEHFLNYVADRYRNKPIIVTENGVYSYYATNKQHDPANDVKRVRYHQSYLAHVARAMRNGADVRGYMVWSLMDNFEWDLGYRIKFGLYRVESGTLNRIPKLAALWYRDFL
ncbi:hypothetical protein M569_02044, partial [Genlisea aurea]